MDSDEKRLAQLGYKQELKRDLSTLEIFAVTISSMTIFTGIVPYFGVGLLNGGTIGPIWGWIVVSFFVHFIGFALAEICSCFPTTGSIYFWAASLAGPKYGPVASFITGWLEYGGLTAQVGSAAYAGTQLLQNIVLICTGGANGGGYVFTPAQFLAIVGVTIFISALIGTLAVHNLARLEVISLWTQTLTALVLIIGLPLITPTVQPASFVFTHWQSNRDVTGLPSESYSWVVSLLLAQYSLYGFDTAAHMTEETKSADRSGPFAIIASVSSFSVLGFLMLVSFMVSIKSYDHVILATDTVTGGGYPVAQILWDSFNDRFGSSAGAVFLLCMIYWSFFFGCISVMISAARVAYAMSRDHGMPLSFFWRRLSRNKVPVNAVWASALLGFIIVIPVLKTNVVFFAITGLSTVGWVGSYSIPIFFRLLTPEESFKPGPFYLGDYLGKYCKVVHLVALGWVLYTVSVFMLPTTYPITWNNFNYTGAAFVVVGSLLSVWWVVDARKWFKGPVREVPSEVEAAEVTLVQ